MEEKQISPQALYAKRKREAMGKEAYNAMMREYNARHREKINATQRLSYQNHIEYQHEYEKTPERRASKNERQNTKYNQNHLALLQALGGKCISCGNDDLDCLQVDHINNDGNEERRRISGRNKGSAQHSKYMLEHIDSGNYQILCANCNWKKRRNRK